MPVDGLSLPPHRHVPGENERPDDAFFLGIRETVRSFTLSEIDADYLIWLYGLRLFNEGFYWEVHEMLEPIWLKAAPNSRERRLVQGVIHLANGLLKEQMGRSRARQRIAGLARKAFEEAFPQRDGRLMGMDCTTAFQAAHDLLEGKSSIAFAAKHEI